MGAGSAAADGVYDLDAIAGLQPVRRVLPARHDFLIDLDGESAPGQIEQLDQLQGAEILGDLARRAVDDDFHGVGDLDRAGRTESRILTDFALTGPPGL